MLYPAYNSPIRLIHDFFQNGAASANESVRSHSYVCHRGHFVVEQT